MKQKRSPEKQAALQAQRRTRRAKSRARHFTAGKLSGKPRSECSTKFLKEFLILNPEIPPTLRIEIDEELEKRKRDQRANRAIAGKTDAIFGRGPLRGLLKHDFSTNDLYAYLNTTKNISPEAEKEILDEIAKRKSQEGEPEKQPLVSGEPVGITMPLGRYKGTDLGLIPDNYLLWMIMSKGWITSIFRATLQKVVNDRRKLR